MSLSPQELLQEIHQYAGTHNLVDTNTKIAELIGISGSSGSIPNLNNAIVPSGAAILPYQQYVDNIAILASYAVSKAQGGVDAGLLNFSGLGLTHLDLSAQANGIVYSNAAGFDGMSLANNYLNTQNIDNILHSIQNSSSPCYYLDISGPNMGVPTPDSAFQEGIATITVNSVPSAGTNGTLLIETSTLINADFTLNIYFGASNFILTIYSENSNPLSDSGTDGQTTFTTNPLVYIGIADNPSASQIAAKINSLINSYSPFSGKITSSLIGGTSVLLTFEPLYAALSPYSFGTVSNSSSYIYFDTVPGGHSGLGFFNQEVDNICSIYFGPYPDYSGLPQYGFHGDYYVKVDDNPSVTTLVQRIVSTINSGSTVPYSDLTASATGNQITLTQRGDILPIEISTTAAPNTTNGAISAAINQPGSSFQPNADLVSIANRANYQISNPGVFCNEYVNRKDASAGIEVVYYL